MPGTAKPKLTCTFLKVATADLLPAARSIWAEWRVLDDLDARTTDEAATRLIASATELGLTTVAEMLQRSGELLRTATGVPDLTRFTDRKTAALVQDTRALLGCLLAASCSDDDSPLTVFAVLPAVAPSSADKGRPLRDAEIMAVRAIAVDAIKAGGRRLRSAAAYCLAEGGMTSGEITHRTPHDFDDPRTPTRVEAPGAAQLATPRWLDLSPFARYVLTKVLNVLLAASSHAAHQPIAYTGTNPEGSMAASASVNGVLKRLLTDAGISESAVTPGSIRAWRLAHIYDHAGEVAALDAYGVHGRDDVCRLRAVIHRRPKLDPRRKKKNKKGE